MPDSTTNNIQFFTLPTDPDNNNNKEGLSFGFGIDPVTAAFSATAAFFNFLCTAQGQRIVSDILNFDAAFANKVHDLFVNLHDFLQKKI